MRRSSFRSTSNVWPAMTDLVSGILLSVTVVMILILPKFQEDNSTESLQKQLAEAKTALASCQDKNKACEAEVKKLQDQKELLNKRITSLETFKSVTKDSVKKLESALSKKGVKVYHDEYGNIEIEASVLFGYADATISGEQLRLAKTIGGAVRTLLQDPLLKDSIETVLVIGHTDSEGPFDVNMTLSLARAEALVAVWTEQWAGGDLENAFSRKDIPKLLASGFGESRPKINEKSPVDRQNCRNPSYDRKGCAANRRIEIRIIPKEPKTDDDMMKKEIERAL